MYDLYLSNGYLSVQRRSVCRIRAGACMYARETRSKFILSEGSREVWTGIKNFRVLVEHYIRTFKSPKATLVLHREFSAWNWGAHHANSLEALIGHRLGTAVTLFSDILDRSR